MDLFFMQLFNALSVSSIPVSYTHLLQMFRYVIHNQNIYRGHKQDLLSFKIIIL